MSSPLPKEYYYTETHEWVSFIDKRAFIGLTHYSTARMGLIIHIHPAARGMIQKGDTLCEIESSKVIIDIKSPLSGTIEEIHEKILTSPELITRDPYSSWIARIKLTDVGELKELFPLTEYESFVENLWKN
ncbi:MAG: glycine cleavage system protein H [Theionarchaea archaeon]|nr:glycine cleavage system protein H [Theionarchaea archaeon]